MLAPRRIAAQSCFLSLSLNQVESTLSLISYGIDRVRPLKIAIGSTGLTKPIIDGTVRPDDLELQYVQIDPITSAFRRMVRNLEYDICEMALSTYLCAKSYGKPITAIPVFLKRSFHHGSIVCNVNSGIKTPKDLEGRTVGVNRGYTVTTGLWARGILQTEYGVDLKTITWAATDDEHVAEYQAPANVDYSRRGKSMTDLLRSGIGAAVGDIRPDPPDIQRLIPDARDAGFAYFRKTGVYPINHAVVIKDSLLTEEPRLARVLFRAFQKAKKFYLAHLDGGQNLSAADETVIANMQVVGDPLSFGVGANRKAIETIVQFAVDQQIIPKAFRPEDLFPPNTLDLE
jgi:4,5-dihydroxyphthalate decarboxylase